MTLRQEFSVPVVDRYASGLLIGALLIASFGLASASLAQERRVSSSWQTARAAAPDLTVDDGAIQLELEDAISISLEQNLGLKIERYRRAQSLFGIQQTSGIYDTLLSINSNANDNTSPSVSALDGSDIRLFESQVVNIRLDQLVSSGGTASVNWTNQRSQTNSVFSQVNPSFDVGFEALFSQPLLRDLGARTTKRQIRISRLNSDISLDNLEIAIVDTITNVEDAYWVLVETREQLKVAQESLANAEELHQMNQVQVEVGTKAPLELIQSEVGIATRQEDIIRAQASIDDAADQLRQLLNVKEPRLWTLDVVPLTDPQTTRVQIDLERALATAMEERPEVRNQRLQLETLEIDSRFFRNQRRASLDLDLRYSYSGVGGNVLLFAPGSSPFDPNPETTLVPGGYSDAVRQVTDRDFDGWSIGLNFGVPLQNRSAKAQSVIADLALDQGRAELEDLMLAVSTEVRRSARAVRTAAQQIDSAGKSRELAVKNVDAERKRYQNGLSTSFQVLEIQEQLTEAQRREVNAITGYRRALNVFYRSIGRLLEENEVVIDDETNLKELRPALK